MSLPTDRTIARPGRRTLALILAVAALSGTSACSGSEPTPAEARRARVEATLEETFSRAQVDCLLQRLDPESLATLDRSQDIDVDSPGLTAYSEALVSCVSDPGGTTTTVANKPATSAGAQTTTTG